MIALLAAAAFSAAIDVAAVHAPYARVRIPAAVDPTAAGDYHDLRVLDERRGEIPYVLDFGAPSPLPLAVAARAGGAQRPADAPATQRVTLDLHAPHVAIAAVRFAATTPAFARDVDIERSDDGATWSAVACDRIARFREGPPHLDVATDGARARFWRITVDNHDDAPLAGLRVTLLARAHTLVFPVERGRRYALVFGDPDLDAPTYDLAARLQHERWRAERASAARIVPLRRVAESEQRMPAAAAPAREPHGDVPGWVPATAFDGAIAVLAVFALRLTRTAEPAEPDPE